MNFTPGIVKSPCVVSVVRNVALVVGFFKHFIFTQLPRKKPTQIREIVFRGKQFILDAARSPTRQKMNSSYRAARTERSIWLARARHLVYKVVMSYVTVEVDIEDGKVLAREPAKLPAKGTGLLTILEEGSVHGERRRVVLPLVRGDGKNLVDPSAADLDKSAWGD